MIKTFYTEQHENNNIKYLDKSTPSGDVYTIAMLNLEENKVEIDLNNCDYDMLPQWMKNWLDIVNG